MNKVNQVSEFVERIFEIYNFDKADFFYKWDDEEFENYEIPLFPNGEFDDEILNRLSIKLGLTVDEILSLDDVVAYKYWEKYKYFELYDSFLEVCDWNFKYKEQPTAIQALLHSFGAETSAQRRYDYNDIKERMINLLKEMDAYMPGTYHPNATIENLTIKTEVLFSFPEITKMIKSFIDMVEKTKAFFFKALKEQPTQEEINEHNFLVNALEIVDVVMPSVIMTYDNICKYKQAYIEEDYEDYFSYVKVKSFIGTGILNPGINPWRCKEFFDDIELVKKLAYIFPEIKPQMRKFEMEVSKFCCDFIWSDAEPIQYNKDDEQYLIEYEYTPLKEHTKIYVIKNLEEIYDWGNYISKIQKATGPVIDGGLNIPNRYYLFDREISLLRIQKRVALLNGGNNNG